MDLDGLALLLLQGAVVVLAAVLGVRLSARLGLPGLLLFLLLGLLARVGGPSLDLNDPAAGDGARATRRWSSSSPRAG